MRRGAKVHRVLALQGDVHLEQEAAGSGDVILLADRLVVGFELRVERWEGKLKLNQNRTEEDVRRVIERLRERGTPEEVAVAEWMTRFSL